MRYYDNYYRRKPKRRWKGPALIAGVVLLIAAVIVLISRCDRQEEPVPETVTEVVEERPVDPIGFQREDFVCVDGKVASGTTFGKLLNGLGVPMSTVNRLAAADSVYDVRKFRAGNTFHAYYTADSLRRLRYFVYDLDKASSVVFRTDTLPQVWRYDREVTLVRRGADATIESSLWNDLRSAGASAAVICDLSDIYAWTVDFFGIQPGDRFRVLYDEKVCDGEVISSGRIWYAEYIRGDEVLPAIYYDQRDSGNHYWNDRGESLRRAFLKAPLEFKRISSGYSMNRRHPVHGDVRPHTGVDYAAPLGTPVRAVGDGQVIKAGWGGGGGNTIKIRHNATYTTGYLHLQKFAPGIREGVRVRQGQVIGYVGSTGTSTGPHLDYRVWKNNSPVNPLTMEAPPTDPIRPENLKSLDSARVAFREELDRWAPVNRPARDSVHISE